MINGDCLEVLKEIKDKSVDLFILDLPYGQTACKWDLPIDLNLLWIELKRIARNKNTGFIFFTTTKFGYKLIQSNEKWFKFDLVWDKPNGTSGFLHSKRQPLRSHEMIYVFYENPPFYNMLEHHTRINKFKGLSKNETQSVYGSRFQNVGGGLAWSPALPKSVIKCNTSRSAIHPTKKPEGICEWLIKYFSKEGDTILDPTAGVGSIGVACKKLNRNFIGIEKNSDYFNIALDLISQTTGRLAEVCVPIENSPIVVDCEAPDCNLVVN